MNTFRRFVSVFERERHYLGRSLSIVSQRDTVRQVTFYIENLNIFQDTNDRFLNSLCNFFDISPIFLLRKKILFIYFILDDLFFILK